MPTSREFTVRMEDRPGALGKLRKALADRKVNILAFQSSPFEGQSAVRLVVDDPVAANKVLDAEGLPYTEAEVAQVRLQHAPGELGRAASRLGEAQMNINYAYSGIEPGTNAPLLIFGVAHAAQAAAILEKVSAQAA